MSLLGTIFGHLFIVYAWIGIIVMNVLFFAAVIFPVLAWLCAMFIEINKRVQKVLHG